MNDVLKMDSSGRECEPESVEVDDEASEVMAGFDRCFSTVGVFKLLETIPESHHQCNFLKFFILECSLL